MKIISYRRHRFPSAIIAHAVWLNYRFTLSYRDLEDLLVERGIDVSYETIRRWCTKFGAAYAARLRVNRARPSATWHIDEVFVRISGKQMYLWRLVDDEGEVLDVLLQAKRDKLAAERFLRRAMKKHRCTPAAIISDKWRPTGAAVRSTVPSVEHVIGKRLNNRAENSHLPTRRRERKQQRFKSTKSAQRFLSTFSDFYNQFNIQRHLISRATMKRFCKRAFTGWVNAAAVG